MTDVVNETLFIKAENKSQTDSLWLTGTKHAHTCTQLGEVGAHEFIRITHAFSLSLSYTHAHTHTRVRYITKEGKSKKNRQPAAYCQNHQQPLCQNQN